MRFQEQRSGIGAEGKGWELANGLYRLVGGLGRERMGRVSLDQGHCDRVFSWPGGRGQDVVRQVERELCGSGDEEVPTLPLSVRDSTSREQQEIREMGREGFCDSQWRPAGRDRGAEGTGEEGRLGTTIPQGGGFDS